MQNEVERILLKVTTICIESSKLEDDVHDIVLRFRRCGGCRCRGGTSGRSGRSCAGGCGRGRGSDRGSGCSGDRGSDCGGRSGCSGHGGSRSGLGCGGSGRGSGCRRN
ncbi:unnamed protein product [Rotaria sp. Silwood1]|nr:unnamed protein product [Rotaria sp. Silwood1]CAF1254637.1 unnamed protein product [Rotaria sp. Silwood1]CAF3499848.1 unnamed protein product [Rotaria sp. Silwood1]CAF4982982.1 unnamed protein product [Rotaria sp. Silwood1]